MNLITQEMAAILLLDRSHCNPASRMAPPPNVPCKLPSLPPLNLIGEQGVPGPLMSKGTCPNSLICCLSSVHRCGEMSGSWSCIGPWGRDPNRHLQQNLQTWTRRMLEGGGHGRRAPNAGEACGWLGLRLDFVATATAVLSCALWLVSNQYWAGGSCCGWPTINSTNATAYETCLRKVQAPVFSAFAFFRSGGSHSSLSHPITPLSSRLSRELPGII